MIYGGIDIGTTQAKITIFDDDTLVFRLARSYVSARDSQRSTVSPCAIMEAVDDLLEESGRSYPCLSAVGVSSFGEAFVLLDQNDNVLYDVMLYSDPRGQNEVEGIRSFYSEEEWAQRAGFIPNSMFSLCKLVFLRKNHPEIFDRIKSVCLIEDYVVYCLSGVHQVDYALASRTLAFDRISRKWNQDLLKHNGIDPTAFSFLVPPGTVAGPLRKEKAKKYHLSESLLVVTGAHDQIACALGAGLFDEGDAVDGAGTCECLTPLFHENAFFLPLAKQGFGIVPYPLDEHFVGYGMITTSGALFDWFARTFFSETRKKKEDLFSWLDGHIRSTPTSVLLLPYFAGSGVPFMDSRAEGAFFGLHLGVDAFELYQALLESLAYELRALVETLATDGLSLKRLLATGGGSRNEKWLQIKADVVGLPIVRFDTTDSGAVGTAILVRKALGVDSSLKEGANRLVHPVKTFIPNQEKKQQYEANYHRYRALYPRVSSLWKRQDPQEGKTCLSI